MSLLLLTFSSSAYRVDWRTLTLGSRRVYSESMVQLNTVPWPQPVVTVRFFSFSSQPSVPACVVTLTDSVRCSTLTDLTCSSASIKRWLRR